MDWKKEMWEKLRNGDPISDEDLNTMLSDVSAAIPYLEANLPYTYLACRYAWEQKDKLEGFLKARTRNRENILF